MDIHFNIIEAYPDYEDLVMYGDGALLAAYQLHAQCLKAIWHEAYTLTII